METDARTLPILIMALLTLSVAGSMWVFIDGAIPFLGSLPGDLHYFIGGRELFFPITTCILLSIILVVVAIFTDQLFQSKNH